jgi:hypothetical protein
MLCCFSRIGVTCGLNATFFSFFGFNKSSFLYQNKYKKTQIYFSKFNTCTLIINYISKSCCSLSKKDLKIAKFRLRCTRYTFCSSNFLFIQQLLDILYSFKEKKENRSILCPERNPVWNIIVGSFNSRRENSK